MTLKADTPLGANFTAGEFSGHDTANAQQESHLRRLVEELLQPARSALGLAIVPTSWLRSSGSWVHRSGAAVDAAAGVPGAGLTQADTFGLWVWLAKHKRGELGELIYEQPETGVTGHVHVTLPGYGGNGQVLYETLGGAMLEVDPFLLRFIRSHPGEPV